jgi:hypothetical protein
MRARQALAAYPEIVMLPARFAAAALAGLSSVRVTAGGHQASREKSSTADVLSAGSCTSAVLPTGPPPETTGICCGAPVAELVPQS